jgi:hypothetical protein
MNEIVSLKGLELVGKQNAIFQDNSGNSNCVGLHLTLNLGAD